MTLKLATFLPVIKVSENHRDEDIGLPYPNKDNVKNIDDRVVKVSKLDNGNFKLTFNLSGKIKHFDITRDIYKPRTKYMLYTSIIDDDFILVNNDYVTKNSDGNAKIVYTKVARNEIICNIYFHDSFEEGLLFFNYRVISNEEFIITNKNVWVSNFIVEHFPDAKKALVDDAVAKRKILFDISILDSVVQLEQQVDLLTEIVKALINNEQKPIWSDNYLEKVLDNSVLTVSSVNKIITNIENNKKQIRELQKKYFEAIE
jgi:hypothetical protein